MSNIMRRAFRHILLAVLAFAIVGGSAPSFAVGIQSCANMTAVTMPCGMAMPASTSDDTKPMAPCNGVVHCCMCLMYSVSALPAEFQAPESRVQYSLVDYWSFMPRLASLSHQPEPLPPRTT